MREMWGRPSGCHIGSIFWRPTTMFPDHENPSNIAAAAATAPGNSEASTPEEAAPPVARCGCGGSRDVRRVLVVRKHGCWPPEDTSDVTAARAAPHFSHKFLAESLLGSSAR